jgi:hypothetical protein
MRSGPRRNFVFSPFPLYTIPERFNTTRRGKKGAAKKKK